MKSVRYEHAILQSASSDYSAQFHAYVKAASSPQLHKSLATVLIVVSEQAQWMILWDLFGLNMTFWRVWKDITSG